MTDLFTQDQIDSINAYQVSGIWHPFTCECGEVLNACSEGMKCPKCGHLQTWAHEFMSNWSWVPLEGTLNWAILEGSMSRGLFHIPEQKRKKLPPPSKADQLHAKLDEAIERFSRLSALSPHEKDEARQQIRSLLFEIGTELGESETFLTSLHELTMVPSKYRPDDKVCVRMSLEFDPYRGWWISRDDHAGGGPFRRGPVATLPDGAVRDFVETVKKK